MNLPSASINGLRRAANIKNAIFCRMIVVAVDDDVVYVVVVVVVREMIVYLQYQNCIILSQIHYVSSHRNLKIWKICTNCRFLEFSLFCCPLQTYLVVQINVNRYHRRPPSKSL